MYVFVLTEDGNETDFLIFSKEEIERQIKLKNIWKMKTPGIGRLKFYVKDKKVFLGNMENDVTKNFNNWDVFLKNKKSSGRGKVVV